jgi:hypothetical protein
MKAYLSNLFKKLLAKFFTPHQDPTAPTVVAVMKETQEVKEVHTSDFEPIGPPGYHFDRVWNQWRDARNNLIGVGEDPYKHFERVAIRDGNAPKWQDNQNKVQYNGAFKYEDLSAEDKAYIYWKMRFTNQTPLSVSNVVVNGNQTDANRVFEDGEREHWNTGNAPRWEDYTGKVKKVF